MGTWRMPYLFTIFSQYIIHYIFGYYYSLFGLVDQTIDGRRERERHTQRERFTDIKLLYTAQNE